MVTLLGLEDDDPSRGQGTAADSRGSPSGGCDQVSGRGTRSGAGPVPHGAVVISWAVEGRAIHDALPIVWAMDASLVRWQSLVGMYAVCRA